MKSYQIIFLYMFTMNCLSDFPHGPETQPEHCMNQNDFFSAGQLGRRTRHHCYQSELEPQSPVAIAT